jgi:hypothetical protein
MYVYIIGIQSGPKVRIVDSCRSSTYISSSDE